jgi:hypothetical protein
MGLQPFTTADRVVEGQMEHPETEKPQEILGFSTPATFNSRLLYH